MVAAAARLRDYVIHRHVTEWEHDMAAHAYPLLAAIERVPVRPVVLEVAEVRPTRYVCAVGHIVE